MPNCVSFAVAQVLSEALGMVGHQPPGGVEAGESLPVSPVSLALLPEVPAAGGESRASVSSEHCSAQQRLEKSMQKFQ